MSLETGSNIRTNLTFIPQVQSKEEISVHKVRATNLLVDKLLCVTLDK